MDKVKNDFDFVVCARLHTPAAHAATEDNTSTEEYIANRLNRIERVALSFDGKLVRRANSGLLISFKTANHAVLAACEIQRRCADMPQPISAPIRLAIGIHKASSEEEPDAEKAQIKRTDRRNVKRRFGFDTAGRLASTKDEDIITISILIHAMIDQPLKDIATPLPESKSEIRSYQIDWKAPINWQNISQGKKTTDKEPAFKLLLQHGSKQIELSQLNSTATFGRDPGCDIMINGSYVSRIHAQVEVREEGCFLIDQSANGTIVRPTDGGELLIKQTSYPLNGSGQLIFGSSEERRASRTVAFFVLDNYT